MRQPERREPPDWQLSRDDTGCPRSSKEGIPRQESPRSLHFGGATHVACRLVTVTLRCTPGSFAGSRRFGTQSPASGASRERRPRDRPPGAPSEGMAPHSGADHARDDHEGSAQAGFSRSNADRGCTPSAEEDRGLVWVCPCVENVRQKSEVRLQPRRCVRLTSPSRTVTTRGQGLALREHLVRTSVSTSLESRREFAGGGEAYLAFVGSRDRLLREG